MLPILCETSHEYVNRAKNHTSLLEDDDPIVRSACGITVQAAMICLRLSICLLVVLMTSSGVGGKEERQQGTLA